MGTLGHWGIGDSGDGCNLLKVLSTFFLCVCPCPKYQDEDEDEDEDEDGRISEYFFEF